MARKPFKNKRGKALGIRIRPREGLWIKYQLRLRGLTVRAFAEQQGVKASTVSGVLGGLRQSNRLEEAAAQTLGYPNFEALIASRGKGGAV